MGLFRKLVAKRKSVKAKKKPAVAKKEKKGLTAKKTARKQAAKEMSKTVTSRKLPSKPKKGTIVKLLTAEGWRRLMTGAKK